MPLRDHFHPPVTKRSPWDALHGAWPTVIVADLNRRLPPRYVASPRIHLGTLFEIDVAASETDGLALSASSAVGADGGAATAVWAPPQPTLTVATDLPDQDEYEVLIHEDTESRRLVAAIEIVSPSNKDRPDHRGTFVAKCATLLQQGVSVSIVDLVTTRQFNLYADLMDLLGQADPWLIPEPAALYAVACRWRRDESGNGASSHVWRLETWAHALEVGRPLPILPLWLASDFAVPLELEWTYEETCRILRVS